MRPIPELCPFAEKGEAGLGAGLPVPGHNAQPGASLRDGRAAQDGERRCDGGRCKRDQAGHQRFPLRAHQHPAEVRHGKGAHLRNGYR